MKPLPCLGELTGEAIEAIAASATARAVEQTRGQGLPITVLERNALVEVGHDGDRTLLRELSEPRQLWWDCIQGKCPDVASPEAPCMVMVAGPNGSGKSTIIQGLRSAAETGPFVNADLLQSEFQRVGRIDLAAFGLSPTEQELERYLQDQDGLVARARAADEPVRLRLDGQTLAATEGRRFTYTAALVAAFIRACLIKARTSFVFETVLSHVSKLNEVLLAKDAGFQTHLVGVCTEDSDINLARVSNRVRLGGHAVPEEAIRRRYAASLRMLCWVAPIVDAVALFDNSGPQARRVG